MFLYFKFFSTASVMYIENHTKKSFFYRNESKNSNKETWIFHNGWKKSNIFTQKFFFTGKPVKNLEKPYNFTLNLTPRFLTPKLIWLKDIRNVKNQKIFTFFTFNMWSNKFFKKKIRWQRKCSKVSQKILFQRIICFINANSINFYWQTW